jgi:hypothetical protein
MFPRLVRETLSKVGFDLPGRLTDEAACEGAKHHSPTPLMVKEVSLSPSGGGTTAWLCGTCADNLAVLQHLRSQQGDLSWPLLREFGNRIRALAQRGWSEEGSSQ